jgi:flagellar basal body P-ring formation protein FlgA
MAFRCNCTRFAAAVALASLIAPCAGLADDGDARWMAVPVPAATLLPGDALDAGVLTERRFQRAWAERQPFARDRAALAGQVALRTLPKGRPIPLSAIAEPAAVEEGRQATVIFASGTLRIATTMLALDGGATGDVVRMRNVESGTVIQGRVTGHRQVTVGHDGIPGQTGVVAP